MDENETRDAFPIIHFIFVWSNDTPPYAHCALFGGKCVINSIFCWL